MPRGLPDVERIVVIGEDGGGSTCQDLRALVLPKVDRWVPRPRTPAISEAAGGEHAALHLRHDRPSQRGHADQRQLIATFGVRGRATFEISGRHREPGGHAALPHRRFGMGAVRHVSGGGGRFSARRRSGSCSSSIATERITEMFVVPAVLMLLLAPAFAGDRSVQPAPHLLRGVAHLRRPADRAAWPPSAAASPGLRHDRDYAARSRPCPPRITIRADRGTAAFRRPAAMAGCRAPDRRSRRG